MRRVVAALFAVASLAALGFAVVTAPGVLSFARGQPAGPTRAADLANGRTLFLAGGCASCHAVPGQEDRTLLGGGLALASEFGTFHVPNISAHPSDGIGAWTAEQFILAMREGVSPEGRHYYPAFPYASYQRMGADDLADMLAYLKTLPAVEGRVREHQLAFPFSVRRTVGVWKWLYLDGKPFVPDTARPASWNRGAYLVEGPGHCAECHSPRGALGGIDPARRFAGGPDPEGRGFVPNITPHQTGIGSWSAEDIAEMLKSGVTPTFDSVGGTMAAVVRNTAELSDADRAAMAEYLRTLPPLEGRRPPPS